MSRRCTQTCACNDSLRARPDLIRASVANPGCNRVLAMNARARVTTDPCSGDLCGDARRCSCSDGRLFCCASAENGRNGRPDVRWRCRGSGLRGASGVGLPQPLSPSEAVQVRRIFLLQDSGSVADAARETGRLGNDLLLGAILADRYLRSVVSTAELAGWLARFGDQPEAPAIRDPAGACGAGHDGGGRRSAADAAAWGATGGGLASPAVRAESRCRGNGRFPDPQQMPMGCLSVGWPRCGLASPTLRPGCSTPHIARRRHRRCEPRAPSGQDTWHSAAVIVAGSPSGCVAPRRKVAHSMA